MFCKELAKVSDEVIEDSNMSNSGYNAADESE